MGLHDGTGTGWEETSPDIDQPHGILYKEIQDLRKGTRIRTEKEHVAPAADSAGGEHVPGGCQVLEFDTEANLGTLAGKVEHGIGFSSDTKKLIRYDGDAAAQTVDVDHGSLSGLADKDHPAYIAKDGSTADISADIPMNGHKITGLAAATANGDAVRKEQLFEFMPAGMIMPYVGSAAPTGWLICNGATISDGETLYPNLWAVLPAAYKSGANIVLPNLKGRVVAGYDAAQTEFNSIGKTGGEKTHSLTAAESGVPAHTHGLDVYTASDSQNSNYAGAGVTTDRGNAVTKNNTAEDAASAHNNLQPYIALNYIMKAH
jgi:microcystin-dependent protein